MDIKEKLTGEEQHDFSSLCEIMTLLRGEGGCPWDREQTHESIRRNFIEETYEVVEAIDKKDTALLREELGDVMLQVVFHAQIEAERGTFDINDVANDICEKLIHRHPHIFGNIEADTSEAVLVNWEKIKMEEKSQKTVAQSMKNIPPHFPALLRADKIGKKAAKVGFDFPNAADASQKIYEEAAELTEAMKNGTGDDINEELGDLLFAVVNTARLLDIDPEYALSRASDKFITRFEKLENEVKETGGDMKKMTLLELDEVWNRIKSLKS